MKPPKFDPAWAFVLSISVVPLACALNSTLFEVFFSGVHQRFFSHFLGTAISTILLTGPLGFMTNRLLETWQKGHFSQVRWHCFTFSVFAFVFWFWIWTKLSNTWSGHISEIGALAIPFLWSILFPLSAIFARAQNSMNSVEFHKK